MKTAPATAIDEAPSRSPAGSLARAPAGARAGAAAGGYYGMVLIPSHFFDLCCSIECSMRTTD